MPYNSPVIGLLFGIQNGLEVSIIDASDAIYECLPPSNSSINFPEIRLNLHEIQKKKTLWTAVYANYELLGWYSVGKLLFSSHIEIHNSVRNYCDYLLTVMFDFVYLYTFLRLLLRYLSFVSLFLLSILVDERIQWVSPIPTHAYGDKGKNVIVHRSKLASAGV